MSNDQYWMRRAIALSQRGIGWVNPNPMVGAIVVGQDRKKISQGYHEKCGQAHAEKIALEKAGPKAKGATLYVTLEPCSHHGKTPPCLDAILQSGVSKVVIGSMDPNPKVSSVEKLKKNDIEVVTGVLEKKVQKLNRIFFSLMQKKSYIMAKIAISKDGYIGHQNRRIMISSNAVIHHTMKIRAMVDGILVGKNTWKVDDPTLTVRGKYKNRKPARILIDPILEIKPSAHIFQDGKAQVFLVYDMDRTTPAPWMDHDQITCLGMSMGNQGFSPTELISILASHGIQSLLIEGGCNTLERFSRAGCIDDWVVYQSEKSLEASYQPSELILAPELPFSLAPQSAIRCGQDRVYSSLS